MIFTRFKLTDIKLAEGYLSFVNSESKIIPPECDDIIDSNSSPANLFCLNTKTGDLYAMPSNSKTPINGTTFNVTIEVINYQFPYRFVKGFLQLQAKDFCAAYHAEFVTTSYCKANFQALNAKEKLLQIRPTLGLKCIIGISIPASEFGDDTGNFTIVLKGIKNASSIVQDIIPIVHTSGRVYEMLWNYYIIPNIENRIQLEIRRNEDLFGIDYGRIIFWALIDWSICEKVYCINSWRTFYELYLPVVEKYPKECFQENILFRQEIFKMCTGMFFLLECGSK